jgi:pimeloyl-ACP methyl ester carboxylesterase
MIIEVETHPVFYQATGSGSNGLIFIHGLGGDHRIWRKNVQEFESTHRVIAVDLFGHGLSDKKIEAVKAWELFSPVLQAIIRHENLEKVVLVGHSLAGLMLQAYSSRFAVDLLVFVDCALNDASLIADRESTCREMLSLPADEVQERTRELFLSFTQAGSAHDDEIIFSPLKLLEGDWIFRFLRASNHLPPHPLPNQRALIIESSLLALEPATFSFRHAFPSAKVVPVSTEDHYFFVRESGAFNQLLRSHL